MKMKKMMAITTAMMLAVTSVGCGSGDSTGGDTTSGEVFKVGMITDTGGVNDESFNQSAWEGLERARDEFGTDVVEVSYIESTQDADYIPNIEQFVDEGLDLIIGIGYKLGPAIEEAAGHYPDQQFAIVDEVYEVQPENVTSLSFDAHVAGYLVGLVAGKMTETDIVGFIGGMEVPVIEVFEAGYRAGVAEANPNAEILYQNANSYTDSALGKSIARQMYQADADIIFSAAGNVGTGVIEAAKEMDLMAIGVDRDQNSLAPENVITSAMKNVGVGTYNVVEMLVNGTYEGGQVYTSTLESGGVGLAPTTNVNVPQDILDYVDEISEKIISGEIVVPTTIDGR